MQARRPRSVGLACISGSQAFQDRKHFAWCFFRFAGETPASPDRGRLACRRLYSTANERGLISQPLYWLPIGNMQAGRPRSVGLACISGSQAFQDRKHFAWCFFRFAGGTPASPDRGRLACRRLYSTANERGLISQPPFCLPIGKLQPRLLVLCCHTLLLRLLS
ncbi:MAG: hypothetical protein LBP59_14140 [Planctomycetaceae bacterium]|jgi:hypothetical protein|nr:hypothetical protein [Planctomycetaceae bacterium]